MCSSLAIYGSQLACSCQYTRYCGSLLPRQHTPGARNASRLIYSCRLSVNTDISEDGLDKGVQFKTIQKVFERQLYEGSDYYYLPAQTAHREWIATLKAAGRSNASTVHLVAIQSRAATPKLKNSESRPEQSRLNPIKRAAQPFTTMQMERFPGASCPILLGGQNHGNSTTMHDPLHSLLILDVFANRPQPSAAGTAICRWPLVSV